MVGERAMSFYTSIGPKRGAIMWFDNYRAIGVLSAPENHVTVGMALRNRCDDHGRQLYRLSLHDGGDLPGA